MGRHAWDRRRHGPAPGGRFPGIDIGLVIGLILLVIALIFGIDLVINPAQCDGQPMTAAQVCQHHGRTSERLLDPYPGMPSTVLTVNAQISHNQTIGALFLGFGGLAVAGLVWLGVSTVRDLWHERQWRRTTADTGSTPATDQP